MVFFVADLGLNADSLFFFPPRKKGKKGSNAEHKAPWDLCFFLVCGHDVALLFIRSLI